MLYCIVFCCVVLHRSLLQSVVVAVVVALCDLFLNYFRLFAVCVCVCVLCPCTNIILMLCFGGWFSFIYLFLTFLSVVSTKSGPALS